LLPAPWLVAVGDVVLSRAADGIDPRLHALLAGAEISFANLEIPLTLRGAPQEKAVVHRGHPDRAADLRALGIDVATLANNHMLDYGADGLSDTLAGLQASGVAAVGAGLSTTEALRPHLADTDSGRVAFLGLCATLPPGFAAADQRPGVAPLRVLQQVSVDTSLFAEQPGMAPYVHTAVHVPDLEAACEAVARAAREADVVVVGVHWGVPLGYAPATYGLLAEYQQPCGRALVDAGARLVIGHHPHVVHPLEVYGGGLIAYSVGNFLFHSWTSLAPSAPGGAGGFQLGVPAAPYRNPFGGRRNEESVAVVVQPAAPDGSLLVRFVPTVMVDGDPVLPDAARAAEVLGHLLEPTMPGTGTPELTLRDDVLPGTVVAELWLGAAAPDPGTVNAPGALSATAQ
jgi:poly-gamma-glutamate capsule biosynthesis protein CapA/YwtB (metallophosphatase superfamily)